jgi:DNA replication initiation complex subunit (GINS family)
MEAIKITLETLYDILRSEKKQEDLQKLEITFFVDVVKYLSEKRSLLDSTKNNESVFASGEHDKVEYELRSIKRILKELYEKREKKIIDIALNRSRTGSDIIDTSAMLFEEKEFYGQVLNIFDRYRAGIINELFQARLPRLSPTVTKEDEQASDEDETTIPPQHDEPTQPAQEETSKNELEAETPAQATLQEMIKVKFLHPTPKFVWKDLKVYGPFDTGEETEIFPEVAELLVRKGRAQKV